jgi:hypothetical protein
MGVLWSNTWDTSIEYFIHIVVAFILCVAVVVVVAVVLWHIPYFVGINCVCLEKLRRKATSTKCKAMGGDRQDLLFGICMYDIGREI